MLKIPQDNNLKKQEKEKAKKKKRKTRKQKSFSLYGGKTRRR